MNIKTIQSKIMAWALSFALVLSMIPTFALTAFAEEGDDCTHIHDDNCGYKESAPCLYEHEHDGYCGFDEDGGEHYADTDTHVHDGGYGYAEAAPYADIHTQGIAAGAKGIVPDTTAWRAAGSPWNGLNLVFICGDCGEDPCECPIPANPVVISAAMTANELKDAIEAALSYYDTPVTVTGTKTNVDAQLSLTIPANKTVVWEAVYEGHLTSFPLINLTGGGVLLIMDGNIDNTSTSSEFTLTDKIVVLMNEDAITNKSILATLGTYNIFIKWNGTTINPAYGTSDGLSRIMNLGTSTWDIKDGKHGISYSRNTNTGFIDMTGVVTVICNHGGNTNTTWSAGTAATCTTASTRTRQCSVCGEAIAEHQGALGHTRGAADCTACGRCSQISGFVHSFNVLPGNGTQHQRKCGHCTFAVWVACSGGTATCTSAAICSTCNTAYGSALNHNFTNLANNPAPSAAAGHHTVECARAGCSVRSSDIACTPGTAATCTENQSCTVTGCNRELDAAITPDPTCPHTNTSTDFDPAPTCTADGAKAESCDDCGSPVSAAHVSSLDHSFPAAWTVRTSATATAEGLEYRVCARNGCSEEETRAIPATGGGNGGGIFTPPTQADPPSALTPEAPTSAPNPDPEDVFDANKAKALADQNDSMTLDFAGIGIITIGSDAMALLAGYCENDGTSIITVVFEAVNMSDLQGMQAAQVKGYETVVSIDVFVGDTKVDVPLTVSLPYTLKANENPVAVKVWYMDSNGDLTDLKGVYDSATGMITFSIPHQSYFVVGYDPVALWNNIFRDVPANAWYYDAVAFANSYGLFNGNAGNFMPNDSMTRAMFVTALWNLEGKPSPKEAGRFTDVAHNAWYHNAVQWAAENDVVGGVGGGNYAPDRAITRQEMAVMLMNYANYKGYDIPEYRSLEFVDSGQVASWAEAAVKLLSEAGVISGSNNAFMPHKDTARAEVAALLKNFLRFVVVDSDSLPVNLPMAATVSAPGIDAYMDRRAWEAIERAMAAADDGDEADHLALLTAHDSPVTISASGC